MNNNPNNTSNSGGTPPPKTLSTNVNNIVMVSKIAPFVLAAIALFYAYRGYEWGALTAFEKGGLISKVFYIVLVVAAVAAVGVAFSFRRETEDHVRWMTSSDDRLSISAEQNFLEDAKKKTITVGICIVIVLGCLHFCPVARYTRAIKDNDWDAQDRIEAMMSDSERQWYYNNMFKFR